jgi:large subunit ribosomal protein L9
MKVILLQHVKGVGRIGDIKEVSDGYATNALFPKGLAKQATSSVLHAHTMNQKSEALKQEKNKANTIKDLHQLDGHTITFKEKMNSKGVLYHAIGTKEIIKAISDQYGIHIQPTFFKKSPSYKEIGTQTIELVAYDTLVTVFVVIEEK